MPDFPTAVWMPAPASRYWVGRASHQPKYVILHGTAGGSDARALASWLNTQVEREATSVHYVIGQDGTIVQCVSELDSAWANGVMTAGCDWWWSAPPQVNPNYVTVSIEHCKPDSQNATPLTPAQQRASFALVADICRRHRIPARKADSLGGITGHFSIDPINRAHCPGDYPWDALWAYLANGGGDVTGEDDMSFPLGVPAGWTDDGTTLTAPNKVPVTLGFRQWILEHGWNPADWPLAPAYGSDSIEPGNPQIGKGTRQDFRLAALGWTAERNVYRIWLGQDVVALQQQLTAARGSASEAAAVATAVGKRKRLESSIKAAESSLDAAIATAETGAD